MVLNNMVKNRDLQAKTVVDDGLVTVDPVNKPTLV